MIHLSIDLGPIHAARQEAEDAIKALPAQMRAAVQQAAFDERHSHTYRNRTGTLQKRTTGKLTRSTKSLIRAELALATPYASFIVAKGLSTALEQKDSLNAYFTDLFNHL